MSVIVHTSAGTVFTERAAEGWHIDEQGFLHLRGAGGKGNLAAYAPGAWSSVSREHKP